MRVVDEENAVGEDKGRVGDSVFNKGGVGRGCREECRRFGL